jgi:hypothetical protein
MIKKRNWASKQGRREREREIYLKKHFGQKIKEVPFLFLSNV